MSISSTSTHTRREHLVELRKCFFRYFLGFAPAFVLAWFVRADLYSWLLFRAFREVVRDQRVLGYEYYPILEFLSVSALGALLVSSPWFFYQLWSYVSWACNPAARRLSLPFVVASTLCLFGACYLASAVVTPAVAAAIYPDPVPNLSVRWSALSMALTRLVVFCVIGSAVLAEAPIVLAFLARARR